MDEELECCVCMKPKSNTEEPAELSAVTTATADATMLWSACHEHIICKGCLVRIATSFGQSHPIGPEHPMIPCPYPFEPCVSDITDVANYFPHSVIDRILCPADRERYKAHANRFQFPGYELVQCPRPVIGGGKCGTGILVSIKRIQKAKPGNLIMICDQSAKCQRRSCYHCHAVIARQSNSCEICLAASENTNPAALNRYFYRYGKVAGDKQPALMRNSEITVDIATRQILELIKSERLEIRCTECLTVMLKSEQCNTLDHCGIERCYSCGRSGTRNQKLGDHWDSMGINGCPRFDHAVYWNIAAYCDFRCIEGTCYNDEIGDCNITAHQAGIKAMIEARRAAHVYHALKSLMLPVRKEVARVLAQEPVARKVLPRFFSSDYRTYLSEPVMRLYIKTKTLVEGVQPTHIDEANIPTWEFARNFTEKASKLTFEEVTIEPIEPPLPKHVILFNQFRHRYARRYRTVKA